MKTIENLGVLSDKIYGWFLTKKKGVTQTMLDNLIICNIKK